MSEALDGGDLPTAARLIAAVLIQAGACADDVAAQLSEAAGSAGCERVMDAVQQAYQVRPGACCLPWLQVHASVRVGGGLGISLNNI